MRTKKENKIETTVVHHTEKKRWLIVPKDFNSTLVYASVDYTELESMSEVEKVQAKSNAMNIALYLSDCLNKSKNLKL